MEKCFLPNPANIQLAYIRFKRVQPSLISTNIKMPSKPMFETAFRYISNQATWV